jgi:hypothetical protein
MSVLSVKGAPPPQAWMTALFLASIGPTMAQAQEVVPSACPSATAPGGDSAQPKVDVARDAFNSEEPEPSPAVPGSPPFFPDPPPDRVRAGPLGVIRESIFGAAKQEDWQFAVGDQPGPQTELVRGCRRHLRASQRGRILLHGPHDQKPGIAVDFTPLGARQTEHQRQSILGVG